MEVNPQGKSIQIIPLHNIKAIEFKETVKKFIVSLRQAVASDSPPDCHI